MKTVARLLRIVIADLEATGVTTVVIGSNDDCTPSEAIEYFKNPAIQEKEFNYDLEAGNRHVLLIWE